MKKFKPYHIVCSLYRIAVQWASDKKADEVGCHGWYDVKKRTMYLRSTLDKETLLHTKLHEYLHVVQVAYGIDMDKLDEQTVDTLSSGLAQILQGRGVDPEKI